MHFHGGTHIDEKVEWAKAANRVLGNNPRASPQEMPFRTSFREQCDKSILMETGGEYLVTYVVLISTFGIINRRFGRRKYRTFHH